MRPIDCSTERWEITQTIGRQVERQGVLTASARPKCPGSYQAEQKQEDELNGAKTQ